MTPKPFIDMRVEMRSPGPEAAQDTYQAFVTSTLRRIAASFGIPSHLLSGGAASPGENAGGPSQ